MTRREFAIVSSVVDTALDRLDKDPNALRCIKVDTDHQIYITLCPNCKTIQKAGTECGICKCPVDRSPVNYPESDKE